MMTKFRAYELPASGVSLLVPSKGFPGSFHNFEAIPKINTISHHHNLVADYSALFKPPVEDCTACTKDSA